MILQLLHPYTFIPTSMVIREMRVVNFDLFWTDLIQNVTTFYINIFLLLRNQIWSSLIHFGQIWFKKIKNKRAIFILSVNVTIFYRNIFRLLRKSNMIKFDQVWSILDRSDSIWSKKNLKIENLMMYFNDYFIRNPIWSSLIRFDPIWSILIHFDRSDSIWSKK